MKKTISLFLLTISVYALSSKLAFAGCDACLQNAIQSASGQMNSAISQLDATVRTNVQATQTLTSTVNTSSASLTTLMEAQHRLMMSGLDAASVKLELSNTATTDTIEKVTDHLANEINAAFKNQLKAKQVIANRDLYGPLAIPLSSDIAANRSEHLALAIIEYETLADDYSALFNEWILLGEQGDATKTLKLNKVNERVEELKPLLNKLSQGVLVSDDIRNIAELYRLILLPSPRNTQRLKPQEKLGHIKQMEALKQSYNVLISSLLMQAPILSTQDWNMGYIYVETLDDMTSLGEFLKAETQRKMLSSTWQIDIKTRTEAGLLREKIVQNDMTNYLLYSLLEEESRTLALLNSIEMISK